MRSLRAERGSDLVSTTESKSHRGLDLRITYGGSSYREWGGWNGFWRNDRGCGAVRALRRGACRGYRARGSGGRAQERGADGGVDGTGAHGGAASVLAA